MAGERRRLRGCRFWALRGSSFLHSHADAGPRKDSRRLNERTVGFSPAVLRPLRRARGPHKQSAGAKPERILPALSTLLPEIDRPIDRSDRSLAFCRSADGKAIKGEEDREFKGGKTPTTFSPPPPPFSPLPARTISLSSRLPCRRRSSCARLPIVRSSFSLFSLPLSPSLSLRPCLDDDPYQQGLAPLSVADPTVSYYAFPPTARARAVIRPSVYLRLRQRTVNHVH